MENEQYIQGTTAWLELRKTKITATDAVTISELSPYSTTLQLWEEKKGLKDPQFANAAMQKGSEMEEVLRHEYIEKSGINFFPDVIVPDDNFIMASLDGITFDKKHLLEIKYTNKKYFEDAKNGQIPEHFFCQIQHQLMCVPEAIDCALYLANADQRHVCMIEPDKAYQEALFEREKAFFESLKRDAPPPKSERDFLELEETPALDRLFGEYMATVELRKSFEDAEKEYKKQILEQTDDGNCRYRQYKISKAFVESFDYKKACIDAGVDLEKYKKSSIRWTILVDKNIQCDTM